MNKFKGNGLIMLEGRNTIHDALLSEQNVVAIYVARVVHDDPKVLQIMQLAKERGIEIKTVSHKDIAKWSQSKNAQNVMAEVQINPVSLDEIIEQKANPCLLVVNSLDYEQNLGALLRTAWGAGVDAVIVSPAGVHQLTPVVTKVSMGGAVNVPLIAESLFPALKKIQDAGIPIVGLESDAGEVYTELNLTGPIAFVIGGEDSGLTEPLKKYCDKLIHVPMNSKLSSLNVNVATAVVLFEKLRQERS